MSAQWFALIYPLQFGLPHFEPVTVLTVSFVMIVVMIESTGMFLALSEMIGKAVEKCDLSRGLRTDGLGRSLRTLGSSASLD